MSTLIIIIIAAFGVIISLITAGVFVQRGTAIKGIDIMDKVIDAYGVAEKLNTQQMHALNDQLNATQLERDALKVQLITSNVRISDLERATGTWVLERERLLADIATLKKQNRDQEIRITQLESMTPHASS